MRPAATLGFACESWESCGSCGSLRVTDGKDDKGSKCRFRHANAGTYLSSADDQNMFVFDLPGEYQAPASLDFGELFPFCCAWHGGEDYVCDRKVRVIIGRVER